MGTEQSVSGERQLPAQQLRDQRQPEGDIHGPTLGSLGLRLQREIVVGNPVAALRHAAQALGVPDTVLVAVFEQAAEHPGGARGGVQGANPGQQLDEVQGQRQVLGDALGIGQRVTVRAEEEEAFLGAGCAR